MPDMATITTVLTSLKAATDIAKFIGESDASLEKAELKMKVADLMTTLADARIQAVGIQDLLAEKDAEIARLSEAMETRSKVVRMWDGIYSADETGQATGLPHCLSCWTERHKLRPLITDPKDRHTHVCTSCGHKYQTRLTPSNAERYRKEDGSENA